jgi:starch synthase
VPVVRATGGLADTVTNYSEKTGKGTGFTFEEYTARALLKAVEQATGLYKRNQETWRTLQLAGMAEDHSWDVSAREYVKVYRGLFPKASARRSRRRATTGGQQPER